MRQVGPISRVFLVMVAAAILSLSISSLAYPQADRQLRRGYVGTVTAADDSKDRGTQVVFSNLDLKTPTVAWPSGRADEFVKVFEDEDLIVLFFVGSLSGGTTVVYLNKQTSRFTVVDVNAMEASALGLDPKPILRHGVLK